LNRLDLPSFDRPTIAISGSPSRGKSRGPAALVMNSAEILKGLARLAGPAGLAGLQE
jgi:hypothetical protein